MLIKPILLKNKASAFGRHGSWKYIVVLSLGLWWNLDSCLILHLVFKDNHERLNIRPKSMKFSHNVNILCTWDFYGEQSQTESKLFKRYAYLMNRGLHFFWPSLFMPDYSHFFNLIGTHLAISKHLWDAKNSKNKVNIFGASGSLNTTIHYWLFLQVKNHVEKH